MPDIQLPMLPLEFYASDSRRAVGALGEAFALRDFQRCGYEVMNLNNAQSLRGDVGVIDRSTGEIFKIEVKASRLGKDKTYRFTLFKRYKGRTCADYRHADYVLLIALRSSGVPAYFLIPVSELGERTSLQVYGDPSDYTGKWSRFRVRADELKVQ